jgi:opacity protein-like surface antigen
MRAKKIVFIALILTAFTAAPARAEWFLSPNIGLGFGGDTLEDNKVTFGGQLGYLGAEVFGFEVDFGITPNFYGVDEDDEFDVDFDSNVTTFMVNAIASAPQGALRPFASGGVGIIRSRIDDVDDFFDVSNNDFGLNVGGGLMGNFSDNVGWRGEIRYFRALADEEEDNEFDVGIGDFDFWRSTFGITFNFGG